MSNPFRGSDVAADQISPENIADMRAFFQEHMGDLQAAFAELDQIVETGDERLLEEKYGHLRRPHPDPQGRCIAIREKRAQFSLCKTCEKIFAEDIIMRQSWIPSANKQYAHHYTLQELHEAAGWMCPLCLLLWTHITGGEDVQPDTNLLDEDLVGRTKFDKLTFSVSPVRESAPQAYYINFFYAGNDSLWDYDTARSFQLCLVPTSDPDYKLHQGVVSEHTSSKSSIAFAANHIRQCEETHTKCSERQEKDWKPTRLIDLGPPGATLPPRLLHTENIETAIPYVTLSHRWGSAKMFQLTSKNVEDLKQSIPVGELSKTFQDAFLVCKWLEMRYIWIDSLCIMQDSAEDWQKEAALMQEVYSQARFNVSATGAVTSDEGLFFDRASLAVVPYVVNIDTSENPDTWKKGTYNVFNPSVWSSEVTEKPLNQRGWVLQERVLARRVVHFGRDQVFFECRELDACESFPTGLPDTQVFQQRPLGAASNGHFKRLDRDIDGGHLRESKSMSRLKPDPMLNVYSIWAELVETYSTLALTKWEDKLVAFSGIAKMMCGVLDDEYLAGLWKRHLPYHMLWSRRKDGGLRTEPTTYIAPSWSWASVQAPVTLHPVTDGQNEDILIDILEVETYAQSENVTGSVFGGFIKVRGFLRPAECAVWHHDPESFHSERKEILLAIQPNGPAADIIVWPDETDQFGPEGIRRSKVWCLPIQIWRDDNGIRCTEGLMLERFEYDTDAFKRIGKFKVAVGAKQGEGEFYKFSAKAWKSASARDLLARSDEFEEKTITVV